MKPYYGKEAHLLIEKLICKRRHQGRMLSFIRQELLDEYDLKVSEAILTKYAAKLLNKTKYHERKVFAQETMKNIDKLHSSEEIVLCEIKYPLLYTAKINNRLICITPEPSKVLFPKVSRWEKVKRVIHRRDTFWTSYDMALWSEDSHNK